MCTEIKENSKDNSSRKITKTYLPDIDKAQTPLKLCDSSHYNIFWSSIEIVVDRKQKHTTLKAALLDFPILLLLFFSLSGTADNGVAAMA